jgi:hypothetical protein
MKTSSGVVRCLAAQAVFWIQVFVIIVRWATCNQMHSDSLRRAFVKAH